jgi:Flp pilus assembly protein TadB
MKKTIQSLYTQMNEQEKLRAETERQQRDIHGAGGKMDLLAAVDEKLAYSGIREKVKWITTEVYIILVLIITVVISTAVTLISGPVYGILTAALVLLIFELALDLLIMYRNKKTESVMLQFMNIVDNFSRTSDDLVFILERSSRYIEEPLGSQIYDAVIEARNTGNTLLALQDLQDKVKNKHFKVLVRNLEIASRYETNYSDIIEDCRDIFHDYIKNEKEKRSIRVNGLIEIFTMLLTGTFCLWVLGDMTDYGGVVAMLMAGGLTGKILLVYLIVSIVAAFYIAVFKVLRAK